MEKEDSQILPFNITYYKEKIPELSKELEHLLKINIKVLNNTEYEGSTTNNFNTKSNQFEINDFKIFGKAETPYYLGITSNAIEKGISIINKYINNNNK